MKCSVKKKIRKLKGGWKVAEESDDSKCVQELLVNLTIEGNSKEGYFLADSHYESLEEALEDAHISFGVSKEDWLNI